MKRNEACLTLSMLADNFQFFDNKVSKEILKARDIVVCEPNKILDVLADEKTKETCKYQLIEYIQKLVSTGMISYRWVTRLLSIKYGIINGFDDLCEEMYLPTRCKDCPNFKGSEQGCCDNN